MIHVHQVIIINAIDEVSKLYVPNIQPIFLFSLSSLEMRRRSKSIAGKF